MHVKRHNNLGDCWSGAIDSPLRISWQLQTFMVYRLIASRVWCAFRTILDEAVLIVAGMVPVDILAKEMSILYHARRMKWGAERRNAARLEWRDLWQCKWNEFMNCRWMFRPISNIRTWVERKHRRPIAKWSSFSREAVVDTGSIYIALSFKPWYAGEFTRFEMERLSMN